MSDDQYLRWRRSNKNIYIGALEEPVRQARSTDYCGSALLGIVRPVMQSYIKCMMSLVDLRSGPT